MALKLAPALAHPPPILGNYCLFSGALGYALALSSVLLVHSGAGEVCLLGIPSTGAASHKRPHQRYGLRSLGRHLAATSAPRPHRGALQRPGAKIQAANEHRLQTARPVSAASPRLLLRLASTLAACNLRTRAELPGACSHDCARHSWLPGLLHLRSPKPHGACPHSGTGQVLPRTREKCDVPQRSSAYHRSPKLGHPRKARNPRPWVLHRAFALGLTSHKQSLSPNLLHLQPQPCGQLLRGPQQDPRPLCLPRSESYDLQDSSPAVHDAGEDSATPREHQEARTCILQRGQAPEALWLELRDQTLRLPSPHDTVPRGRLMPASTRAQALGCLLKAF